MPRPHSLCYMMSSVLWWVPLFEASSSFSPELPNEYSRKHARTHRWKGSLFKVPKRRERRVKRKYVWSKARSQTFRQSKLPAALFKSTHGYTQRTLTSSWFCCTNAHFQYCQLVCLCLFFQFIIEDMKQQQTNKHSNLHREDQHITVEELWKGWKTSEGEALKPVTQDVLKCYSHCS